MSQVKEIIDTILSRLRAVENAICAVGLIVTTVLIFAQVINRYWLQFEIMWLSDLALYCFIFFMLIAAAVATWREGHVAVDFFHDKIVNGRPILAALYKFILNLMALIVLIIFIPVAYGFMKQAVEYPQYGTLVRWFNESWLQITLFVAMLLVLLHLVVLIVRDLRTIKAAFREKSQKGRQ